MYQNSRPKKSIGCQNNEYRRRAFYNRPRCTVLFTVPLIRQRTVHWLPIPKAGTACSFPQGDVYSPRGAGRHALSLPASLLYQQNKKLIRSQSFCKAHRLREEGTRRAGGQMLAEWKITSPADWLRIWLQGSCSWQPGGERSSEPGLTTAWEGEGTGDTGLQSRGRAQKATRKVVQG